MTVSDASGQVAFRGMTNANATFATTNLRPGNYVVQFNAKSAALKGNQYLLVVSAGEKKVIADAVPGEKITAGGVAMRVAVGSGLKISGQVASQQLVESTANPNIMVRNGKRYAWVTAETGSNLGGHWVEVGLGEERHIFRLNSDELRKIQDRAYEGNMADRFGPNHHHFVGDR
ncbi:MAG: hypothetical protein ACR2MF_02915 [Chthoniobacterales bacterium]